MSEQLAHNIEEKVRTRDVTLDHNTTFESLLLPEKLLNNLKANGFRKPSPIQLKCIPLGRCGFDLIAKAKSGTGKTLVFAVVALEALEIDKLRTQSLIIVPTREIAVQVVQVIRKLGGYQDGMRVEAFIGGQPVADDVNRLPCHIAVGTTGRIKHLIQLGHLDVSGVTLFVIDEADKLFETSFLEDLNSIYDALPHQKQMIATSATYPTELADQLSVYMLSPTVVSCELDNCPLLLGLRQYVCKVQNTKNVAQEMSTKNRLLLDILGKISFGQCLIFCKYQSRAESISHFLVKNGWNSDYISANLSQKKRLKAIENLKEMKCKILLSTDLTARGIDAAHVDLVINYDTAEDPMVYLHRMGRAGRYGSEGVVINLVLDNGVDIVQFQKILGAIGGVQLRVPHLPNDCSNLLAPNTPTIPGSEWVEAVVGEHEWSVNKVQVLDIMKQKGKPKKSELKDRRRASESESTASSTNKRQKNNKTVKDDQVVDLQSEDQNATGILCERDDTDKIFTRNSALFSVAKIISKPLEEIDGSMVESLERYLSHVEDEDGSCNHQIDEKDEISMSDFFELAFQQISGLSNHPDHYLDRLPKRYRDGFKDFCESGGANDTNKPVNLLDDFDVDEEDEEALEEYEAEEEVDEQESGLLNSNDIERVRDYATEVVQASTYLPWHRETTESIPDPLKHQFQQYYQHCSDQLWQNGATFRTTKDFEQWFDQWTRDVIQVRNYAHHNLYISEMAKYQNEQLKHT